MAADLPHTDSFIASCMGFATRLNADVLNTVLAELAIEFSSSLKRNEMQRRRY